MIHWLGGDAPPRHADSPSSALASLTDLNGKTTSHRVVFNGPLLELPPDALEGLQLSVRFKVHVVRRGSQSTSGASTAAENRPADQAGAIQ